jgi:hypothetical protein
MSLQDRAMLVSLHLSKWGVNRQDEPSATDLALRKRANSKAIRVTKRLLADNTAYDAIRKFDSALSSWYRANTVPFDDNDARLLPTTEYDRFTTHMRNSRTQREALVRGFLIDYDAFVSGDRRDGSGLGEMWNAKDYPDRFTVAERFGMKLDMAPVPDKKHFLVTIGREELLELQRGVDARIAAAEAKVRADLFRQLSAPIMAMAEKLASDRKLTLGTTGPLVENLQTVLALIPRYNLTGDKDLDAFCTRAKELSTVAPETLKTNPMVRGSVARRAQAIIDEMSDFMGGAPSAPLAVAA